MQHQNNGRIASIAGVVVVADQLTKAMIRGVDGSSLPGWLYPIVNDEMALQLVDAPGLATLLAAMLGLVLFGGYLTRRAMRGAPAPWIPAFVVGGSLGNIVDRISLGAVQDFLALPGGIVVNVADLALMAAVGGLLVNHTRRFWRQHWVVRGIVSQLHMGGSGCEKQH